MPEIEIPGTGGKKTEPQKARSYKEGLELLTREFPFDPSQARYGRFTPSDRARSYSFQQQRIGSLHGSGWLTEVNGRPVFWFEGIVPYYVHLSASGEKAPISSNVVAGTFKEVNWQDDIAGIEKAVKSKRPEEMLYTGAGPMMLFFAAILQARGESDAANRLAGLAIRASREQGGDTSDLLMATAINCLAEARYRLAIERDAVLDLARLRTELADILRRYEGCVYNGAPMRELELNIAATLDLKQKPSPFLTWKYTQVDRDLLTQLSSHWWVLWDPAALADRKNSPLAALAMRGVEAIPELLVMAGDHRVTSLLEQEQGSGMQFYDIRSLTRIPTGTDLQERMRRFLPRPLTLREIALKMLSGILLSQREALIYGETNAEASLTDRAADFYAKYKGLSGFKLAAAVVESGDTKLSERMLESLSQGNVKLYAPLLKRYAEKDPPTDMMLQLVAQFSSSSPELAGPVIEAFLSRAPDAKALAKMIEESVHEDYDGQGNARIAQIERMKLSSQPATAKNVMQQILVDPLNVDVLETGLGKVDSGELAKEFLAAMGTAAEPRQVDVLLLYLIRAKTLGAETGEEDGRIGKFLKAIVANRQAWESIFTDKRPGRWAATLGDSAVGTLCYLITDDDSYARTMPAVGGELLIEWMKQAIAEHWAKGTPIKELPNGRRLSTDELGKLKTAALAAPNLEEWLRSLTLEQGLALPILAGTDPEVAKLLRPVVTRVGKVEVLAPPSAVTKAISELEGKTLTPEILMDLFSRNFKEDLDITLARTEVPAPIRIIVNKRARSEENPERILMFSGFHPGMEELRQEPTYLGNYPDLDASFQESSDIIRQLMESDLAPEGSGSGFFLLTYGPNEEEN